jgi:caffeoyl-CoA O-methyltransferase
MTPRSFLLTPELAEYVRAASEPPDDVAGDLLAETAAMADRGEAPATFQIAPEQGAFMQLLTRAVGARRAIEIGTFTGFSALCIARGLPADGRLLCLDVDKEWTSIAQGFWDRAGLSDRIDLILGPAAESLANLPEEPTFDLAFIDADKVSYLEYYELLLPRVNTNGLILVDNVLQYGNVVRRGDESPTVMAVKHFNAFLAADPRVEVVMLPVADGLTLARKLPHPRAEA